MTNLVTQSKFAELKGHHRSYVTHLKQKGLLVMRGKFVNISETEKRLMQFSDPSKQAVVERHAQERAEKNNAKEKAVNPGNLYQISRAQNEKYKALSAQADYELKIGKLMLVDDVVGAVSRAGVVLRTRIECLPDYLAATLAVETDEAKIKNFLQDNFEQLLNEFNRQFIDLSKKTEFSNEVKK